MPMSPEAADAFTQEINSALDKQEAEAAKEEPKAEATDGEGEQIQEEPAEEEAGEEENQQEEAAGEEAGEEESKEGEKGESAAEKKPAALDNRLLARAAAAGIALSDARSFPDNDSLSEFVSQVEAHAEHARFAAAQEMENQQQQADDPLDKLPKLNPDEYEPEVIEYFKQLTDIVKAQRQELEAFRSEIQGTQRNVSDGNLRELTDWYDGRIAGLGEEYKEHVGVGRYHELPAASPQKQIREDICERMTVLKLGYQSAGLPSPSRDELFDTAINMVLKDVPVKANEKKLAGQLSRRSKQHLNRGSGGAAKSREVADPEKEVAAMLNEKFSFG